MSGYYYPPHTSAPDDENYDYSQQFPTHHTALNPAQFQEHYQAGLEQAMMPVMPQSQIYHSPQQPFHSPHHYQQQYAYPINQAQPWVTPTVPSNYPYDHQQLAQFPHYTEPPSFTPEIPTAGPSGTSINYLSPGPAENVRQSRAASLASNASSVSHSDASRGVSPNASEMAKWGVRNQNGTWSCAYPGCSSRSTFSRGCDLRKHYKRHTKSLFCRHEGCPQAKEGGFSSKKDRARHEAKHNPTISCEWEGCDRMFSRVDNMKDHVRRVHNKRK